MADSSRLIDRLEERFRRITALLYDTSIPAPRVDEEVLQYCDPRIEFVDPWQRGAGLSRYRLGLAGFHSMFKFDFELLQLNVQLDGDGRTGRAIADGVMHLRQLAPLFTYPLRTILVYRFVVTDPAEAKFLIRAHEEMWSFGDMLAAVPIAGWLYKHLFRRGFAGAFLAASYVASRARGQLPR